MEVHNETKTHKIQLELVDSEMQNLPSIQVYLTFETPTLKYSNQSIWLTIQDLDTFQNSVEELLNNNTGTTNLKSMSHHILDKKGGNARQLALQAQIDAMARGETLTFSFGDRGSRAASFTDKCVDGPPSNFERSSLPAAKSEYVIQDGFAGSMATFNPNSQGARSYIDRCIWAPRRTCSQVDILNPPFGKQVIANNGSTKCNISAKNTNDCSNCFEDISISSIGLGLRSEKRPENLARKANK